MNSLIHINYKKKNIDNFIIMIQSKSYKTILNTKIR